MSKGEKKIKKTDNKQNKIKEAKLHKAYQFRDFEIDMYWKRAQYFWGFLAVIYAGYFLLVSSEKRDLLPKEYELITCSIGSLLSFAWYLVNRGSKRWQEHWEQMINKYEKELDFIVYGEKITSDFGILKAGRYSVSKVNILVSLIIFLSWILLFGFSIRNFENCSVFIIGLVTLFFIVLMCLISKSQI